MCTGTGEEGVVKRFGAFFSGGGGRDVAEVTNE